MQDGDFTLDLFGRSGIIAVTPKESALGDTGAIQLSQSESPLPIVTLEVGFFMS